MYLPEPFKIGDDKKITRVIEQNPLAMLLPDSPELGLFAEAPLFLDQDGNYVIGHLARANPVTQYLAEGKELVCVFRGENAYISPLWMQAGAVPTWNFVTVKLLTKVSQVLEGDSLWSMLRQQTMQAESHLETGIEESWFEQFSDERRDRILSAIVGIKCEILQSDAKFKLSQNRPASDRQTIREQLEQNNQQLADWM